MDGGAWWAAVHGVEKSQTWLRNFPFTIHFHSLEKKMATHSSIPAWRIPGTGELGGLPSMGLHRVRHDWSGLAAAAATAAAWFIGKMIIQNIKWYHLWYYKNKSLELELKWLQEKLMFKIISSFFVYIDRIQFQKNNYSKHLEIRLGA